MAGTLIWMPGAPGAPGKRTPNVGLLLRCGVCRGVVLAQHSMQRPGPAEGCQGVLEGLTSRLAGLRRVGL